MCVRVCVCMCVRLRVFVRGFVNVMGWVDLDWANWLGTSVSRITLLAVGTADCFGQLRFSCLVFVAAGMLAWACVCKSVRHHNCNVCASAHTRLTDWLSLGHAYAWACATQL